ncbi:glycerol-3-phosphate 1-O-acyltransferase PlsY [Candidimonas sp. SYP-B2681]|uniref:glycerol-3-phosphate 1-O-acyltransferase PlsY n=1 Tax=Candidimonas sp. SYP-B2681 TaxID=2497686 RepID=UPI000F882049|nr:glycerol-3-phosphate 1-O-acyltransferase PlsY [Candidimonas sp. SYP-B2681]RTZ47872.1 glycerol-3-phosphate 1-O-acyltransferase PlsY [Candidimonas sp. SYP-B2681]
MTIATSALLSLALVLFSYLLGSVSFAVVVSRLMGLKDPRSFGSKNPGATNVLRTGNKTAAALTLLGDAAKGWLAVYIATYVAQQTALSSVVVAACALAVFLGHVYPVFLKFKGGKGVATALGVLLGLNPWLALATVGTWLIVVYVTRYSSMAAIVSAIFAPLYYLLGGNVAWELDPTIALAIVVISAVLLFRHKANISRLMTGKESRIGSTKK